MPLDGLWSVFGPETTTGQQLRSLFGNRGPNTPCSKIKYPKLKPRPLDSVLSPAPAPIKGPDIAYPKFNKRNHQIRTEPHRPSKRPVKTIRESLNDTPPKLPVLRAKDLSHEKRKLQEAFQFGIPKSNKGVNTTKSDNKPDGLKLPVVVGAWDRHSC